jgi:hypothetical protein
MGLAMSYSKKAIWPVPVEADRLGHVVGDEGEVVEALEQHGDLRPYPGPRGHFPVV